MSTSPRDNGQPTETDILSKYKSSRIAVCAVDSRRSPLGFRGLGQLGLWELGALGGLRGLWELSALGGLRGLWELGALLWELGALGFRGLWKLGTACSKLQVIRTAICAPG